MNLLSKISLACLPLLASETRSHALWIEPAEGGYKVCYGEAGEGLREKREKLAELGPIMIADADGKEIKGELKEDHFFVAAGPAGLKVSAKEAPLYGEGEDAGRPFWHARFVSDAGKKLDPAKGAALEILPDGKDGVSFAVIKGGSPLGDEKVTMIAPGGWSKSFKTDAQGKIRIEAPWSGLYVLEVGVEEKSPGKLKDKPYASAYNAFALSFVKK